MNERKESVARQLGFAPVAYRHLGRTLRIHTAVVGRKHMDGQLFDRAVAQQAAHAPTRRRTLELARTCNSGFAGLSTPELGRRLSHIRDRMEEVTRETELNAVTHSDLVLLKDLYVKCRNELDRRESGQ